jgi:hypothetical protein
MKKEVGGATKRAYRTKPIGFVGNSLRTASFCPLGVVVRVAVCLQKAPESAYQFLCILTLRFTLLVLCLLTMFKVRIERDVSAYN